MNDENEAINESWEYEVHRMSWFDGRISCMYVEIKCLLVCVFAKIC